MNYDEKIDTEALEQQISILKSNKDKLTKKLEDIKKNTNDLKNYWETKTSNAVFSNFEEFYDGFKKQIEDLESDITFLEKTVKDYKEYEDKANKEIDEEVAV